jgi:muramoyltetrapeptide carboxypeptidase
MFFRIIKTNNFQLIFSFNLLRFHLAYICCMPTPKKEKAVIQPPALKPGDLIAITCPAGYMPKEKINDCVRILRRWGYEVIVGHTVGSKSKTYFSGTDEERASEMQAMLDAPEIKAILCGRGGYGTGRIIDSLDFTRFKKHPKWIIGFSDITVLHLHLNARLRIATLHAPMAAAFQNGGAKNKYVKSLQDLLTGRQTEYIVKPNTLNRKGIAKGELIGGNLALVAHLVGTNSFPQTAGKILFLEDIDEQLYNIDRMLHQLKRCGALDQLSGLIFGGFTKTKDTERPFGKKLNHVLFDVVSAYDYPVCFDFPVSHETANYALKEGGYYELKVDATKVTLRDL